MLNLPLPLHLTIEILLLLPFQSILSCKLVSKQLKNLINDPKFYNLYHNKCVALYMFGSGLYCLLTRYDVKIANGEFPPYKVHRIPIGLTSKCIKGYIHEFQLLHGSSNRIACIKSPNTSFLFYNMFTGASYTVEGALKKEERQNTYCVCFGFGYDRYDDDYKIFDVYLHGTKSDDDIYFWVYSFRNRRWESFYGFPYASYGRPLWGGACSFNGVLHWVVATRGTFKEKRKLVILTFDLHSFKFGEILVPDVNNMKGIDHIAKISELDGRLCYVYQPRKGVNPKIYVWVMKEYGVKESWTRLLTDDHASAIRKSGHFFASIPITSYKRGDGGGEVVLFGRNNNYGSKLFWYDMDNKVCEEVQFRVWLREETEEEYETSFAI